MVASAQSCFTSLAADRESAARQCATFGTLLDYRPHRTFTTVLPHRPKTRVWGFSGTPSGRLSRRGRGRSINTPGSRGCAYKTASGRHEWPNRDPLEEQGGINLYDFVHNNPLVRIDQRGLLPLSLNLLLRYFGSENGTPFSYDTGAEISESPIVLSFGDGLLADARLKWACGKSGTFIEPDYSPNYFLNDILAGNWQLLLQGKCNWACDCKSQGSCNCHTICEISENISKTYTLSYVGGNPWNIFTTPTDILPTETFNVSQDFHSTRVDVGTTK